jgi:hypothetical protein
MAFEHVGDFGHWLDADCDGPLVPVFEERFNLAAKEEVLGRFFFTTAFTGTTVTNGTTYFYKVLASDADGSSQDDNGNRLLTRSRNLCLKWPF